MAATERITMAMRELDRFKVIQDVADGKLKPWPAPVTAATPGLIYLALGLFALKWVDKH
ncbi:hypothetical protein [Burkholderia ubonensis]|uniref:hypothetical protein n=1 Tax=Burkholderia ubonensis TaxID=101571 RepID=UPI000A7A708F|nr:hypothetical protein [Burkholderia ubonensis]